MSKSFLFKNSKKFAQPTKESSNKDKNLVLNKWMSDDYKLKEQVQLDPQELDEEFQPQETIVGIKEPRLDTGLLKKRIADKIKNMGSPE